MGKPLYLDETGNGVRADEARVERDKVSTVKTIQREEVREIGGGVFGPRRITQDH